MWIKSSNVDSIKQGHANQATTDDQGRANIDMDELNEATSVGAEDIQASSPMHFRIITHRICRDK